jgi:hypothetical protein
MQTNRHLSLQFSSQVLSSYYEEKAEIVMSKCKEKTTRANAMRPSCTSSGQAKAAVKIG